MWEKVSQWQLREMTVDAVDEDDVRDKAYLLSVTGEIEALEVTRGELLKTKKINELEFELPVSLDTRKIGVGTQTTITDFTDQEIDCTYEENYSNIH